MDERVERAAVLFERAVFGGDPDAIRIADRELDAAEADLALARARTLHARFLNDQVEDPHELPLLEQAAQLYRSLEDRRGEGEATFWLGVYYQVVARDGNAARPCLERSAELARAEGDALTLSYALRHLGFAAQAEGRLDDARAFLEDSVRLRRDVGFHAGVAANLVGLAYLAVAQDRPGEVAVLLEEAQALAEASGAHRVLRWVEQARTELTPPPPPPKVR